jgi:hypothetical protein
VRCVFKACDGFFVRSVDAHAQNEKTLELVRVEKDKVSAD